MTHVKGRTFWLSPCSRRGLALEYLFRYSWQAGPIGD